MTSKLAVFIQNVELDIKSSWADFDALVQNEVATHPIPFFGPIEAATVLTVGVNPSWTEFRNRNWPVHLSAPELAERLQNYFSSDKALPHPWFSRWGEGLNLLGVKYGVSAAHLDLSPRATRAMASCEAGAFLAMAERDVKWFFQTISFCSQARVLLLAGTVTKKWYMHKFLARVAPQHGYALEIRDVDQSPAPTSLGRLYGHGTTIQIFFCGVSPSGYKSTALLGRLAEHKAWLIQQTERELHR